MTHDDHNEVLQLLPWYENGTLQGSELQAVRTLLGRDLEANRQRRELRALRGALVDEPLLAANMAVNWRRLRARLNGETARRSRRVAPMALAAAALLLVTVGTTIFLAGGWAPRYHTLTSPLGLPALPADTVLYRVAVSAGVDAAELTQVAGASSARILQGPSARGVALLAVSKADAQRVDERLRADPRLRFVATVSQ